MFGVGTGASPVQGLGEARPACRQRFSAPLQISNIQDARPFQSAQRYTKPLSFTPSSPNP
jgi:hypothetical protein